MTINTYFDLEDAVPADPNEPETYAQDLESPKDLKDRDVSVPFLEVLKRTSFVVIFALLMLWGVREVRANPRNWIGMAVFGAMLVLSVVHLLRVRHDVKTGSSGRHSKARKRSKPQATGRFSEIWGSMPRLTAITMFALTVFLGVLGEFITEKISGAWPKFAIFLAAFVCNAALYPVRGEMRKNYPTFTSWALLCAVMGVLTVLISLVVDWMERGGA